MTDWTRRDVLRSGLAISAGAAATGVLRPAHALTQSSALASKTQSQDGAGVHASAVTGNVNGVRERLLMDFGWHFHLGHATDPAQDFQYTGQKLFGKTGNMLAISKPDYDDSKWQAIDLPHDWAVELEFKDDPDLVGHGFKPLGRRYPETSIGWYRRTFDIPADDSGKKLWIEFDGAFRDCVVLLNGIYLGRHASGYAPFRFDVTDFLNYGGKNVLIVRVDATLGEGWFYEGAGIYRHVWMLKTHPVHVARGGTLVTSDVRSGSTDLTILSEIDNESESETLFRVATRVFDQSGKVVADAKPAAITISAGSRNELKQQVVVRNPALWSIEEPNLYRAVTTIETSGAVVDSYETTFGIRTIRFDADKGFFLNGKPVKIKGTCNHQDHAGVGAALPDRLHHYRVERLKEMGCNAYRTSHNCPAPEVLDACDRLGMLVMDETRQMSSTPEGLEQLEAMLRRDRNHPSVVIWSLGNEEPEQGTNRGARIASTMKQLARRLDPSRPVTIAMNGGWGQGVSNVVDVQGFNYHESKVEDFHNKFPRKPCIGSETASTVSTRGIYANDAQAGYLSAYDLNFPRWATTAEAWWKFYVERPWLAGGFAWTGFDYRGEPTPYKWPCTSSHFGILDLCGFPKDNFYYYQAWWTDKPVLHLFPHWNWLGKEGAEIDVWCHSNLDEVELFLNGRSLGRQSVPRNSHLAWKVRYAPGTLEARGYKQGKQVLVDTRQTTGSAVKLVLHTDRQDISADHEDLAMIDVQAVDDEGRVVPDCAADVTFRITGNGKLIGVGNGDPSSHEPDKADRRKLFSGRCQAIVQSTNEVGELRVEASSGGLQSDAIVIECRSTPARPALY